ncbi:MAG: hypothetical protein KKF52_01275, partial [Nanoarchaeota archaeon]|nr:hypothetical protein [Nanoarchaeota archaeon]
MKVKQIKARKILNSRNEPTIEVIVNKKYSAAAPSGASTGSTEVKAYAKNLNDSIDFINKGGLVGLKYEEFSDLSSLHTLLPKIGGNAVIALQFALLKAMSDNKVWKFLNPHAIKLPIPVGNVIGGGLHTKKLSTDIQEFLLIPRSKKFSENYYVNNYLHTKIGKMLNAKKMTDEGAWIPSMSNEEVFRFLFNFLKDKRNTLGMDVEFGLDMAATSFFKNNHYVYKNFSSEKAVCKFSKKEQIEYVNRLIKDYKLSYFEDPLHENDFDGFSKVNKKTLVCGDDLITTNLDRLKEAVENNSINCIIIKPNQIGSVVKTKEVVDYAHKHKIKTIISHRSGETMDTTIADLAVAWNIPYIKTGIYGKERKAKLLRLKK